MAPRDAGRFDLVVVGGGMAGTAAAISAARLGLKVALIQDRPILGGNSSSEVRVSPGGNVNQQSFPALGNLVWEIAPAVSRGNAHDAESFEDDKKRRVVEAEENISLFLNTTRIESK
jgi:flavin-dependent dehydrogenase